MSELNTTAEAIEILQAVLDGKTIQSIISVDSKWMDVKINDNLCFLPNFFGYKYRVKPEPHKFVLYGDSLNNLNISDNDCFACKWKYILHVTEDLE